MCTQISSSLKEMNVQIRDKGKIVSAGYWGGGAGGGGVGGKGGGGGRGEKWTKPCMHIWIIKEKWKKKKKKWMFNYRSRQNRHTWDFPLTHASWESAVCFCGQERGWDRSMKVFMENDFKIAKGKKISMLSNNSGVEFYLFLMLDTGKHSLKLSNSY
jgi:hypothetical protein